MQVQTQTTFTLTLTQEEAKELTSFLDVLAFRDDVEWPSFVSNLHVTLNQELMEVH